MDEAAEQKSDRVQVQGQILKIFKRKLGFFGGIYQPPFRSRITTSLKLSIIVLLSLKRIYSSNL